MPGGADRGSRSDGRQRRSWQRLLSSDSFVGPGLSVDIPNGRMSVQAISPITSTTLGVGLSLSGVPALENAGGLQLQVVSTGGIQRVASGAELNIAGMTDEAVNSDSDEIAIYDASAAVHRKQTRLNFLSGLSAIPAGAMVMTLEAAAPTGWLLSNGDTIGNAASGATITGADLETLFNIIKAVQPNAGTEVFANNDTVTLPDMRSRIPIGLGTPASINALGDTTGAFDHVHSVDPPNLIVGNPQGEIQAQTSKGIFNAADTAHTHAVNIPAFNSASANPPVLVVNFIIKK